VRRICDQYGILLITDEVITGFGRTGTFFGIEHDGVIPDMMCFAKGVTSGYAQLGGVVLSETLHQELISLSHETLFHGYTYSGHPMACAVALKNIEIIETEKLVENAKLRGVDLLSGFQEVQSKRNIIGHVRALGLIGAIQIVKNRQTGERFQTPAAPLIVAEAMKQGLICRAVTFDQDTVVFAPPLIITKQEIAKLIERLDKAVAAVEQVLQSKD